MKNKRIIFLLIFTMFLTACSSESQLSETSTEGIANNEEENIQIELFETNSEDFTIYENDNISIHIYNNMDEKEKIYKNILEDLQKVNDFSPIENLKIEISKHYSTPYLKNKDIIRCDDKHLEIEEFKKDLIKKSYKLYDNWIVEGLYKEIFDIDTEITNFSKYYEEHDFSLFGVRFFEPFSSEEEIKNIQCASIDLVEFLLKKDKKTELLKNNIEISDIEEWSKDKNIDLDYQKEIKSLMNLEVIKTESKLIIDTKKETNGFSIEILDTDEVNEQYDTAEKIEQIILRFDRDILAIKNGIEKDAPKFYKDYKEVLNDLPKIRYVFDDTIEAAGLNYPDAARIDLNSIGVQPHEYGHFLFHDPFNKKGIVINKPQWLDEGIVEYLTVVYSEAYSELMENAIDELSNLTLDGFNLPGSLSASDSLEVENIMKDTSNVIKENNFNTNNVNESIKDKKRRLIWYDIHNLSGEKFTKAVDKALDIQDPIDHHYENTSNPALMSEGVSIGLRRNYCFVNYLMQEYGLEKILYLNVADFSELTYEEVFDKSFEELKADWINYLKDNIKDIELLL